MDQLGDRAVWATGGGEVREVAADPLCLNVRPMERT
jgi:hypothetical protein